MLGLDEILGQPAAVAMLRGLLGSGRVPHALLFHGPDGVGKATTARAFAAALLCERGGESACGECEACRLIDGGNHPDLLHVGRLTRKEIQRKETERLATQEPDASEADLGPRIRIDQIRNLNRLAGLRPRQGHRKLFLIDPAERMNREAQNALLKTLEEPPDSSALILLSARPHLLLPTVRSRCSQVGFSTLRAADLAQLLEARGMGRKEAAARAALSGGSLGEALTLDLAGRQARRQEVCEMLDALAAGPAALEQLPAMAASLAGKDEPTLLDGLALLQGLLRDAARIAAGDAGARLIHADLAERLAGLGSRMGAERAAGLVRSVERLRGDLRLNVNRTLIAEALLAAVAGGPLP